MQPRDFMSRGQNAGDQLRFVPAWAGDAYKFVVTTVMQVLEPEPEAIKRRDASKHLSTEEAIASATGSSTGLFHIQLATAIHITIHYTNLDNIVANSKASDNGKHPSKKARGKVAKYNREELPSLALGIASIPRQGNLRAKMAQWDQPSMNSRATNYCTGASILNAWENTDATESCTMQ